MTTLSISNKQGRGLNIGIWTAQILLLFAGFVAYGRNKSTARTE